MSPSGISPADLREAIASSLAFHVKAYDLEQACRALGLEPAEATHGPWESKRIFVRSQLFTRSPQELAELGRRIVDEYGDDELEALLGGIGITGVDGELKNLIFAADGPKPPHRAPRRRQ